MLILKRRKKKKSPLLSTIKTNSVLTFGVGGLLPFRVFSASFTYHFCIIMFQSENSRYKKSHFRSCVGCLQSLSCFPCWLQFLEGPCVGLSPHPWAELSRELECFFQLSGPLCLQW